ncbi:hypothetical protein K443DRAFT_651969, partial [Laccaria amethystina LaAM-08-1]
CIDGTSNQFDNKNTNVIELYNLILKGGDEQRTWYNSGIGTYARQSWKSLNYYKKVLYHKIDLAIAWDFERTIKGAYQWLSDNYKENDCIFLFGFSRGAFQVRVLSAMIEKVGLIYKGNEMQIPFAYELYADRTSDESAGSQDTNSQENLSKAGHFKKTFSNANVKVHFVGAWDTVSSIGIARGKSMLPGTVDGMKHVCYFRHALALDERRVKFLPEYAYGGSAKPTDNTTKSKRTVPHTKEVWFAGSHSDIGGGNLDNHAMDSNTPPLRWMVYEAVNAGLRTALFDRKPKEHKEVEITESLTWSWLFFEICPFKRLTFTRTKKDGQTATTRWPHLRKGRKIHPGQKIHISVVWSAAGSTDQGYIPKARPPSSFVNENSFWVDLRDKEKKPITNSSDDWLELDLYEYSRIAVETLVNGGDDKAMNDLHELQTVSADARQALYNNVIEALQKPEITLDKKGRLLRITMQLLKKGPGNDPDFKLRPSDEIRPLLSDFFVADEGYQRTACEFVTTFTDLALKAVLQDARGFAGCAVSPDGKRIAAGLADKSVRIWDAETGRPVGKRLRGHDDWVRSVAFSPDGKRTVSGSKDKTIRIWNAETGSPVGEPLGGHKKPVLSVAFSPDSTHIVSSSEDNTIRIWNAESGSPVGEPLQGHDRWALSVAFSPDSTRIVSGSKDQTIRIWDAKDGSPVGEPFQGHDDWIRSVAFSP